MTCYVFWTAIAGTQVSEYMDSDMAHIKATALVYKHGHSHSYVYDSMTKKWTHYTKGVRGSVNECEIPADEVPKPYQFIATLGD